MKFLILAIAAVVAFPGLARARTNIAAEAVQSPGPAPAVSSTQDAGVLRLSMGPTSAPRLPGGTGDQTGSSTQSHKRPKHDRAHSSTQN